MKYQAAAGADVLCCAALYSPDWRLTIAQYFIKPEQ